MDKNKNLQKSKFSLFEVVWAKFNDCPYWPGWIGNIKNNNIYEIFYFGEDTKSELDQKSILKWSNFDKLTENITEINEENKNLLFAISIALAAGEEEMNILEHKEYVKNCSEYEKEKRIKDCFEFLNYNKGSQKNVQNKQIDENKEIIEKNDKKKEKKNKNEFIEHKRERNEIDQNKLDEICTKKGKDINKYCQEIYSACEKIKKKINSKSKINYEEIICSLNNSIEYSSDLVNNDYSTILSSFEDCLKEGFNLDLEKINKEKVTENTLELVKKYEDIEKKNDYLLPFYHIFINFINNVYKHCTNLTFIDFTFVIKKGGRIYINNIQCTNEEIIHKKTKRNAIIENLNKILEIFYQKIPSEYLCSIAKLYENFIYQISYGDIDNKYKKYCNLLCNEIKKFANENSNNSNLENVEVEKIYDLKIDY